nr:hypothetical protein [Micromonospora cremea]
MPCQLMASPQWAAGTRWEISLDAPTTTGAENMPLTVMRTTNHPMLGEGRTSSAETPSAASRIAALGGLGSTP